MVHAGIAALAGALCLTGISMGSGAGKRAIDSGRVLVNDYDGHPHRTAPKRVGDDLSLWCRSSSQDSKKVLVRVFFATRELATRTIECPAADVPRHNHVIRLRRVGTYGMVLSGGGFDGFVIRARSLPAHGDDDVPAPEPAPPPSG